MTLEIRLMNKTPIQKKTQSKEPLTRLKTAVKKKQIPIPLKTTKTNKNTLNTKYANHPDYEYDTVKTRWVKKSDIRPVELINQYKAFLMDYLKKSTTMDHNEIEKLVRKHATSTNRLKEILVEKGIMTKRKADIFFRKNSFWEKELCKHMKTVCPTETDLSGNDWCDYAEEALIYDKDTKTKLVSCYSASDLLQIISSSFTGEEDDYILLQLPRDPYTRNVLTQDLIKKMLNVLRANKGGLSKLAFPHVAYFLRHYKKFYADPNIKLFIKKDNDILTKQEKWKLSEIIEELLTETDELENDLTVKGKQWWFWKEGKKPADMYDYIFKL